MNDIATDLQNEIDRREAAFIAKLVKQGLDEIATDYQDLLTLRMAVDVMSKRSTRARTAKTNGNTSTATTSAPDGFVLSNAVRNTVRQINRDRFRATDVYEALHAAFPAYIAPDKRPSIAATLSNLVHYGELVKEVDGQRKVWYRVQNLREAIVSDQPRLIEGQLED